MTTPHVEGWRHITAGCSSAQDQALDMAEYVDASEYSKRDIVAAGKIIAGKHAQLTEDVADGFGVAHRWRDAYRYPMWRVRMELVGKLKSMNLVDGEAPRPLTAGRLKRMQSIRRKLQRQKRTLYQLQDIGGCRVILPTMDGVDQLVREYRAGGTLCNVVKENDYIGAPRPSGYRSHHIVLKYPDKPFERHFIELQVRTRLQHAWATAVEAVGLVRNEDLKAGEGSPKWLRLFEIMATEFAIEEGSAPLTSVDEDPRARRDELSDLAHDLQAVQALGGYRDAIKYAESFAQGYARYFLIQFDPEKRRTFVSPYTSMRLSSEGYIQAEKNSGGGSAVLVEVDRLADLREAYPNYFLDVRTFLQRLNACLLKSARQSGPDLSWVSDWPKTKG